MVACPYAQVLTIRAFNPAIDTLYWGNSQSNAMHFFFIDPASAHLVRAPRHAAVEVPASYPHKFLAKSIRQTTVCLRILSLILPDTIRLGEDEDKLNCHPTRIPFLPQPAAAGSVTSQVTFSRRRCSLTSPLRRHTGAARCPCMCTWSTARATWMTLCALSTC